MIPKFKKTYTTDKDLTAIQSNAQVVFDQIATCPLLDGVKIEGVLIGTSNTEINHKLGRQPLGYLVTDKLATGDVYRVSWDSRTITLKSSAATTVSLWVY